MTGGTSIRQWVKLNYWEYKKCGRQPEGHKSQELDVCPVTTYNALHDAHGGKNAGRACLRGQGLIRELSRPGNRISHGTLLDRRVHCAVTPTLPALWYFFLYTHCLNPPAV